MTTTVPVATTNDDQGMSALLKSALDPADKTLEAPWPEDAYAGDDAAVYQWFVTQLSGVKPREATLDIAQLTAMKDRRPAGQFPDAAWSKVTAHLEEEISFFGLVDRWFGKGGNYEAFLQEVNLENLETVRRMEQTYTTVFGTGTNDMAFDLELLLDAIGIGVAAVEAPGAAVVGLAIGLAGELGHDYFSQHGGTTVQSPIQTLETALTSHFEAMISIDEQWRTTLRSNWGRLSAFALPVQRGDLAWPDDTSSMRHQATLEFEKYLWMILLPAIKTPPNPMITDSLSYAMGTIPAQQWDPEADQYIWVNSISSSPVPVENEVYRVETHRIGFRFVAAHGGLGLAAMPNDFLYHLFGIGVRNGVQALNVSPEDFFAYPETAPSNLWTKIARVKVNWNLPPPTA